MDYENKHLGKKFLLNWVTANGIGWFVGLIAGFILSYFVVNIFYDKETNLILGLCIGASIGYAQWFVLKKNFRISSLWGLVPTICLGLPFIVGVIIDESGYSNQYFQGDYEFLGRLIFGLIVGLVIGLFQIQFLKPYFKKASWWTLGSSAGWGICLLASSFPMPFATIVAIFGGVLLGLITGHSIIWMSRNTD